jgi:hypothetical protein
LSRFGWHDLPIAIRTAVQDAIGVVHSASKISAGQNSDLVIKLDRTGRSPAFLKGVRGGGRRGMFLGNEVDAGRLAGDIAPAVLCQVESGEWQVVGFEHVAGRAADLSPGSADLVRIASTLDALSERPAGETRPLRLRWSNAEHWRNVARLAPDSVRGWDIDEMCRWSARAPELVDGDRLLHTDLHADQFLITEGGRVSVIDWAFPAAGAPWVDTAFLSLRLTASGHTHAEAQRWAAERNSWAALDRDALAESVTTWAVYVARLWSWFAIQGDATGGAGTRAQLARDYAACCLRDLAGVAR